jgi:V8-like Glu-specific endopeptidase
MSWTENLTALNYLLADLYDDKEETKALVKRAGINKNLIAFKDQPYTNWFNILDGADKQGKVKELLQTIMLPNERGGSADPSIQQTIKGLLHNIEYNQVPVRNAAAEATVERDEPPGNLEKIMGNKSTLLPISFLEMGLKCSRSVVRIVVGKFLGTGFLIDDNWIVTNNHVIPDEEAAAITIVQFNFEKNMAGLDAIVEEYKLLTGKGKFFTNKDDDWTLVKLDRDANAVYGALTLSDEEITSEDFVNIIQHPEGGPKQIALYHNTVTSVNDKYVMYLTDTMPGSSGSPVFNTAWEVVALHHWGGTTREKYSIFNVYRNRGINISRIKKALEAIKKQAVA